MRIRSLSYKSLFILASLALCLVAQAQSQTPALDAFSPDTVLVQFKAGTPANSQAEAHRAANATVRRTLRGSSVQLVEVSPGTVNRSIEAYRRNPNIDIADKNYSRAIYLPATNEGSESLSEGQLVFDNFGEQWNLENTGQEFGLTINASGTSYLYPSFEGAPDADISAPEAWEITQGSSTITIAILDSGVDCNHSDLAGKCVEINSFGGDGSFTDDIGHGTHVAGIAAAHTDNDIGIAGVGWNTSIASLKTCFPNISGFGVCEDADAIEAIDHARMAGYQIVSMSFAGGEPSAMFQDAVNRAWDAGILLVAAAGNIYTDDILYPAGYDKVISVGATDHQDNLSAFSNHGAAAEVLAPGTHILSTYPGLACGQTSEPGDCYHTQSGTSMAAPHVAGLAALIMAQYPTATNADVRAAIQTSADPIGALLQNMVAWSTYGRINMQAALATDPTSGGGNQDPTDILLQSRPVVSTLNAGKGSKYGTAQITLVDNLGNAISDVIATGVFNGSFVGTEYMASTDANGTANFMTGDKVKGGVAFEFCVTMVQHATLVFDESAADNCASF